MAMTERKRKFLIAILGILTGLGVAGIIGQLVALVPAGGVILAVLLVAIAVLTGIGRLAATAKPWMRSLSGRILKNPKVTACATAILVLACFVAIRMWIRDMDQAVAARVAVEQQQAAAAAQVVADQAKRAADTKAADAASAASVARFAALRSSAAANAERFRGDMRVIEEHLANGRVDDAVERNAKLTQEVAEYRSVDPRPVEIAPLFEPVKALADKVERAKTVVEAAEDIALSKGTVRGVDQIADSSDGWTALIEEYRKALDRIAFLENASEEVRRFIPSDLDLKSERRFFEGKLKTAERKLAKAQKAEEFAAAYALVCGEAPTPSVWDGEISEVTYAIKQVAHDPDSIEVKNCTAPVLTKKACWVTTCDVRGKNAFGALVFDQKRFSISQLTGVEEL